MKCFWRPADTLFLGYMIALTTANYNKVKALQVTHSKLNASTFATRPTSKQSWRATLSSRAVARGLKRNADRHGNWTHLFKEYIFVFLCEKMHERMDDECVLNVPVHAREVSPKVACSVSRTDFHCIDKNWITLEIKGECKQWAIKVNAVCSLPSGWEDTFTGNQI